MDVTTRAAIIGFAGAIIGSFFALLASRYGFLGKSQENLYKRIKDLEKEVNECRTREFAITTELNTYYLVMNYLLQKFPDCDKDVKAMMDRLTTWRDVHEKSKE